MSEQQKHFVLVHGASHGAWCWYKLKPALEKSGYRVTALDMAASGINMKSIDELDTFYDYTEPLLEFMASLEPDEKVILVGHSLGGFNLALAMENFPKKIAAAVFLTALMPDTTHKPSHVMEQFTANGGPKEGWLDTQFILEGNPKGKECLTKMMFGPKILSVMYEHSPAEDLQLALMLARPSSFFLHDLPKTNNFSNEGYGLVKRVYIKCKDDQILPEDFQCWMIENGGAHEVKELVGSDHMPMFSALQELHDCLEENALLDMYSSCGDTRSAFSVFREIEYPNLVSFNSIIAGLGEYEDGERAMDLFVQFQKLSIATPDEYTFAAVISAVRECPASYYGEPFHGQVIRYGLNESVFVGSGLISMYFMNGRKESAERVFRSIWDKDMVLWTEMIALHSRTGDAMNAVEFFYDMQQEGHKIDSFSLSSVLSACADLANLKQGEMIHSQAIKTGSDEEIPVCGSLIDMYAKNGNLQAARSILSDIRDPDLKCWNAMIGGYSYHGKLEEALKLFDKILDHSLEPDQVTFISLLSACCHHGSAQTGKYLWHYMKENGVVPGLKHYSCMVSLLSRAGLMKEAKDIIHESPNSENDIELWRTLLSSSVARKDLETGLHAAGQVLKLNAEDAATYVLLSNLYAAAGMWDGVMDTRKMIRGLVLEKSPGLSWIHIEKRIDLFSSGDLSHSKIDEVEAELRRLRGNMVVRTEIDDTAMRKLF